MNACCDSNTFNKTNTKFIHQRRYGENWNDLDSHGGRTVAYSQLSPGRIAYAIAKVHPNDRYVKEIGRDVAVAKLNAGNGGIFLGTAEEFFQSMTAARYIHARPCSEEQSSYFTRARA